MKHRLIAPLAIVAVVAACHVTLLGDLQVSWDIDGSDSAGLCTTYDIHHWHVLANGPRRYSVDIDCGGAWTTGDRMFDVEEGFYNVTVEAVQNGTGAVLASVLQEDVQVISGDPPASILIEFYDSDFSGGGGDTVNVYWNINGTEDGTPTGKSWDTCAEVGASYAEVEVGGVASFEDCHANGNMSAAIAVTGQPQVRVRLADSSKQAITTWTNLAAADAVSGKTGVWEYVAEFYWDSFTQIKDTMTGDYLFQVSYEGGSSCTDTTPNVAHQVSLLTLGGSAVSPVPDVCGPDSICTPADGASFASCYGPNQTQTMADVLWREYKLKISGTLPASDSYEVCWEKTFDIVVGAGTTNPIDALDVDRFSTAGACQ